MPGAANIPYRSCPRRRRHAESRRGAARAICGDRRRSARPVVTTCGSGVTAAILMLALDRAGQAHRPPSMTAPGRNGAGARRAGGDRSAMSRKRKRRRIPMTVTFLEMTARPDLPAAPAAAGQDRDPPQRKSAGAFLSLSLRYDRRGILLGGPQETRPDASWRRSSRTDHRASVCAVHGRRPAGMAELDFRAERHAPTSPISD